MYKFYEVVKVVTSRSLLSEINGQEAAILGMAQNESGQWFYSVQILENDEGWDVMESELQATGRILTREDFYDGESLSIEVNSESGEGTLKNKTPH
ncbi:Imm31 family immunity protein [Zooshikella ganghwensis]|uniref:Imm31 family immunity protein n=1 Tax=Zooshikella ganghwensis TaxID=202772 RepID=UPI00146FC4FD|nr:Imm31 family immunity protein [Zooshikella ganghwensis]